MIWRSILLTTLVLQSLTACTQNVTRTIKDNDKELVTFLIQEDEMSSNEALIFDETLFTNGKIELHRFGIQGSHSNVYIYFLLDGKKKFIDEYSFQYIYNVLNNLDAYLLINEKEQLSILKKIIKILEERLVIFEQEE